MDVSCAICRAEWTVTDESADSVSCPGCGQMVLTRTPTPLPLVVNSDTPSVNETGEWHQGGISVAIGIDAVPVRLGRYSIESLIAEGGFSKVYLAKDEELGRKVALKIPRPEKFKDPARLKLFLAEARLAAKLRHPAIVTIFDVGQLMEGLNYIAMEYIAGQPLSTLIGGKRLSWSVSADLMAKIAGAVHEAHRHGLVHRDIKPSNILLDERGEPRVVDFGLAVHEDSQTTLQGEIAGTPQYMSPEQFRGEVHRLDGRTDIWSLGCVYYQLLTGRRPFQGDLKTLYDEVLNRSPKPPRQIDDQIPRELESICLKCLSKSIEDRYTTAADLAEELRRWQASQIRDGDPPSKSPVPDLASPDPDRGNSTRSRRWIVVAAALFVCGSLGLWAATIPNRPHRANRLEPGPPQPQLKLPVEPDAHGLVDLTAKPFVWLPLLDRKPKPLVWGGENAASRWDYSENRQEMLVDAADIMLAELGETNAGDFKLQLTIIKNSWTGSAGLFWGFAPKNDNPDEGHQCQSLYAHYFHMNSKPILNLRREQMAFSANRADLVRPMVDTIQIASANLQPVEHGERTLEVQIKKGIVISVRWMGDEIESLRDTPDTMKIAIPSSPGRFGIINSFGTSRFRDARFQLLTPK